MQNPTPLSRQSLLRVLRCIQNSSTFSNQDIMSFAGMCTTDEVAEHVMSCFNRLRPSEKASAFATICGEATVKAA